MNNKANKIKTRFAPSPTGELHIGGARTALFCHLFAKKNQGKFILRIEDTDKEREVKGSAQRIQEDLKWLGINWDEGPFFQTDNLRVYQEKVKELLDKGKAYFCFCTEERLDKMRKSQIKLRQAPKYDRKCQQLPKSEIDQLMRSKIPFTVRFLIPDDQVIEFDDLVFGKIKFKSEDLDDQILLKSDGYPTYHLANVVDDHFSEITHVIRGDEWLPSTPKHLLLYDAFGWSPPQFAHMPLIVDQNKRKLSKREHGDLVWVSTYRKQGYLPEAMINFLAFLGWNPGSTREEFTLKELEKIFDLKRVHKSPAVFDLEKLDNLNASYIRQTKDSDLVEKICELYPLYRQKDQKYLEKIVSVLKSRMAKLEDFKEYARYFFRQPSYETRLLIFRKSNRENTKKGLQTALKILENLDGKNFHKKKILEILEKVVVDNGLKNGDLFWPVRVALSGEEGSPPPEELLEVLGHEESLKRIKIAADKF